MGRLADITLLTVFAGMVLFGYITTLGSVGLTLAGVVLFAVAALTGSNALAYIAATVTFLLTAVVLFLLFVGIYRLIKGVMS